MSITLHGVVAVLFLVYVGTVFISLWAVIVLLFTDWAKEWWKKRHPPPFNFDKFEEEVRKPFNFDKFEEEVRKYWREP